MYACTLVSKTTAIDYIHRDTSPRTDAQSVFSSNYPWCNATLKSFQTNQASVCDSISWPCTVRRFSLEPGRKPVWTDEHRNTTKGHIFSRYSEEGTDMQPPTPMCDSLDSPPFFRLCVVPWQTCISVRWPCINVCWKGRSGPVHWFRKALLGLYAWLGFSVIPPDTGRVQRLYDWHPLHTHVHWRKHQIRGGRAAEWRSNLTALGFEPDHPDTERSGCFPFTSK